MEGLFIPLRITDQFAVLSLGAIHSPFLVCPDLLHPNSGKHFWCNNVFFWIQRRDPVHLGALFDLDSRQLTPLPSLNPADVSRASKAATSSIGQRAAKKVLDAFKRAATEAADRAEAVTEHFTGSAADKNRLASRAVREVFQQALSYVGRASIRGRPGRESSIRGSGISSRGKPTRRTRGLSLGDRLQHRTATTSKIHGDFVGGSTDESEEDESMQLLDSNTDGDFSENDEAAPGRRKRQHAEEEEEDGLSLSDEMET